MRFFKTNNLFSARSWAASPGARPTFVEIVGKLEDIVGRSGRRKGQATASVDLPLALSHDLTLGDLSMAMCMLPYRAALLCYVVHVMPRLGHKFCEH
jgi:hypothetical protein